jgi:hypothetical protein
MTLVADEIALEELFSEIFVFPSLIIIPTLLNTYLLTPP